MLPISVIPLSIIGLIVTINGTQDWFSTLYYVVFGIDAVIFILAAIGDIQSILHFRKFK